MRIIISLLLLLCLSTVSRADDSYFAYKGDKKVAIVLYTLDNRGFYVKSTYVDVTDIDKSAKCYAFSKKSNLLFAVTDFGNFLFSISENEANVVRKDHSIHQLEGAKLEAMVASVNDELDQKFAKLNAQRQSQINDSIAAVREAERLQAIERARQDSLKRVEDARRMEQYRLEHDWHWLPLNGLRLECDHCDAGFWIPDSVLIETICNDTIYYMMTVNGLLGIKSSQYHACPITSSMLEKESFYFHMKAFEDVIADAPYMDSEMLAKKNEELSKSFNNALKAKAPYGYFVEWDWRAPYRMLEFNFSFVNTNKRTIKYIDVYWRLLNNVNDVCNTGHFKGTGPVEPFTKGSWLWDSSPYIIADDATRMELTKVIITYMNGSQQTLTKKMIFSQKDFED